MASFIFCRPARRRQILLALASIGGLAGCAAPIPPPAAIAAVPAAPEAVVLVARPLAAADTRGAVLLVLAGSPGHPDPAPQGYDVIAQAADGSLKSCVASPTPPRPGSTVRLAAGARCEPTRIAAAVAIR